MALAVAFGNWDGDLEGSIYCECFFQTTERCETCLNANFITIPGPYSRVLGDDARDVTDAVRMIVNAVQAESPFPRCPTELYAQPAKWVAAFDFLQPYAQREIKQHLDRITQCPQASP